LTERLYYHDAYQTDFSSRIIARQTLEGGPAVRLEATLFYPTSGGQMHDVGWLNDVAVVDVCLIDDEIWHVLAAPLVDEQVHGKLDWPRRFDFMQQHTAFHLLAGAFTNLLQVETLASHLGEQSATIEIGLAEIDDEQIRRIELAANVKVWENRAVRSFFVTAEQAAAMAVRKEPQMQTQIRLVEVQDFDLDPCGGTHVKNTAEVGLIKITARERIRGHWRLTFVAGKRAWLTMDGWQAILMQAGERFTTGFEQIVENLDKALEERKELRKNLQKLGRRVAETSLSDLIVRAKTATVVVQKYDEMNMEDLRWLASSACKSQPGIYLLAATGEPVRLILSSSMANVDLRTVFREIAPLIKAKGGGDAGFVQGSATERTLLDEALGKAAILARQQMDAKS
jgi:alanyl-tRNA synthetase